MKAHEGIIDKKCFRKLVKAQQHIHSNFLESNAIDKAAKYSGLSRFYFSRTYKLVFEETPFQSAIKLKMLFARLLLTKLDLEISEVAELLNYPDPFSFSKAFKLYNKITPSQFRDLIKGGKKQPLSLQVNSDQGNSILFENLPVSSISREKKMTRTV
ncbi:MAG: AraC family transcriptional regulator [Chitinophagaceae bacterium]|nr:AraC family transcriptional regulator [Chitinophagaceae bacterium]